MNAEICSLDDNLLQSALDLRLEQRLMFQHNNNPEHTAKSGLEQLQQSTEQYFFKLCDEFSLRENRHHTRHQTHRNQLDKLVSVAFLQYH